MKTRARSARVAKGDAQHRAPVRSIAEICKQPLPFAERGGKHAWRGQRMRQSVADRHIGFLLAQSSEQSVEYDQHPAVIAVQIFGIAAVVHAMMRGRIEYPFQRTEPADYFGVQKKLITQ